MTKVEKNRVIRTNIINLENKITLISPKISLDRKMAHYKTHFPHIRGWIHHMAMHLPYALHSVIGQQQTSTHQVEIEVRKYARKPLEEEFTKQWNLKNTMLVTIVFSMKKEGYHCLLK